MLESLKVKSAAFLGAVDGVPVEHTFSADDVIMAKDTRGDLKWLGK